MRLGSSPDSHPGQVTIKATAEGASSNVKIQVVRDAVHKLTVKPASAEARTGDVVHFSATAFGAQRQPERHAGAMVPKQQQWRR